MPGANPLAKISEKIKTLLAKLPRKLKTNGPSSSQSASSAAMDFSSEPGRVPFSQTWPPTQSKSETASAPMVAPPPPPFPSSPEAATVVLPPPAIAVEPATPGIEVNLPPLPEKKPRVKFQLQLPTLKFSLPPLGSVLGLVLGLVAAAVFFQMQKDARLKAFGLYQEARGLALASPTVNAEGAKKVEADLNNVAGLVNVVAIAPQAALKRLAQIPDLKKEAEWLLSEMSASASPEKVYPWSFEAGVAPVSPMELERISTQILQISALGGKAVTQWSVDSAKVAAAYEWLSWSRKLQKTAVGFAVAAVLVFALGWGAKICAKKS